MDEMTAPTEFKALEGKLRDSIADNAARKQSGKGPDWDSAESTLEKLKPGDFSRLNPEVRQRLIEGMEANAKALNGEGRGQGLLRQVRRLRANDPSHDAITGQRGLMDEMTPLTEFKALEGKLRDSIADNAARKQSGKGPDWDSAESTLEKLKPGDFSRLDPKVRQHLIEGMEKEGKALNGEGRGQGLLRQVRRLRASDPSQADHNKRLTSPAGEMSARFTEPLKATLRNVLSDVEKTGDRPDVAERKVRDAFDANRDGKLDNQERQDLIEAVGQSGRLRKALDLDPDATRAVEQIKVKLQSAGVAPTSPATSATATNANARAGRSDKGPPQVG